ncbi:MAG: DUF1501 domain-containing protein [Verrucomicrobiota bacterium]
MNSSCNPSHFRNLSRRGFIQVGTLGALGLSLGDYLQLQALDSKIIGQPERKEAKAKNVIQIFLPGGCSHLESWDPKPDAPIEFRGPMGVVKTKIPGVVFSESMQRCAQIVDKLTVIRTVVGKIPDHAQAQYHVLTGYTPTPAIQHASMGAIVSHELGGLNQLPAWIGIPTGTLGPNAGYLPSKFGCFSLGADPANKGFQVRDVSLPQNVTADEFTKRQDMRSAVEAHFRKMDTDGVALDTMDDFYQKAYALLGSTQAQNAFKLDGEPNHMLDLYGCAKYKAAKGKLVSAGERLLLARRLVEAGARFVSVTYEGATGWDTHNRIKEAFQDNMPAFDHALAGLISDLDQRGLLDTTLVMVMTEFGRTPKMDSNTAGRAHHARNFSMVLAGGGTTRGQIYGLSDATASEPSRDGITVEDFLATAYGQLGIDSRKRLMAPGERPIDIIRDGKIIKGLLA